MTLAPEQRCESCKSGIHQCQWGKIEYFLYPGPNAKYCGCGCTFREVFAARDMSLQEARRIPW